MALIESLATAFDGSSSSAGDATALGSAVQEEAARRLEASTGALKADHEAKTTAHLDALRRYAVSDERENVIRLNETQGIPLSDAMGHPDAGPIANEVHRLGLELSDTAKAIAEAPSFEDHLVETLAEVRPMGGRIEIASRARKAIKAGTEALMSRFPSEWIDRSNNVGPVKLAERTQRGLHSYWRSPSEFKEVEGRRFYKITRSEVAVPPHQAVNFKNGGTLSHELMHRMQMSVPNLTRLEREFFQSKTAGEATQQLKVLQPKANYGSNELTKPDEFVDPYSGKTYRAGDLYHDDEGAWEAELPPEAEAVPREILTMGLQEALKGKDTEQARFVLGLLAGL
jgi:hypothetical protein